MPLLTKKSPYINHILVMIIIMIMIAIQLQAQSRNSQTIPTLHYSIVPKMNKLTIIHLVFQAQTHGTFAIVQVSIVGYGGILPLVYIYS